MGLCMEERELQSKWGSVWRRGRYRAGGPLQHHANSVLQIKQQCLRHLQCASPNSTNLVALCHLLILPARPSSSYTHQHQLH